MRALRASNLRAGARLSRRYHGVALRQFSFLFSSFCANFTITPPAPLKSRRHRYKKKEIQLFFSFSIR
jgi:hypothetical protein